MRRTVCVVALALAVNGCSSSGGGRTQSSALADALSHIPDTALARANVEFGRPAAALAADGEDATSGPYGRALGYGLDVLATEDAHGDQQLGLNVRTADYAVTAGESPHSGVLVSGVNTSAAGSKLTALGASQSASDGGTVYRFRPDNQVNMGDKLAKAFPTAVSMLDVVRLDGSDVRFGPSSSALDITRTTGPSLLDDAAYSDLASCLDNPLAAVLTDKLPSLRTGVSPSVAAQLPKPSVGLRALGVGLSGAHGAPPTEQMCVSADSAAHAQAIADSVRKSLASGSSLVSLQKWSEILGHGTVTVDGSTVRMTARPVGDYPGVLLHALTTGDLPGVST
ncbi:MAG TPA: hypothetical protein VE442_09295 [Jatrophihabitans sp.]|jgi:hypothetical protein|nr:hypothetical protein [Jatrophihabitans sp.]